MSANVCKLLSHDLTTSDYHITTEITLGWVLITIKGLKLQCDSVPTEY